MNVELVVGQEVFGRHADGITSQPHSGYPRWVTENVSNLGTLRQPPILKAWHTHGKTPPGGTDFFIHFYQKSVTNRIVGEGRQHRRICLFFWSFFIHLRHEPRHDKNDTVLRQVQHDAGGSGRCEVGTLRQPVAPPSCITALTSQLLPT